MAQTKVDTAALDTMARDAIRAIGRSIEQLADDGPFMIQRRLPTRMRALKAAATVLRLSEATVTLEVCMDKLVTEDQ